jgi:ParB-like chromosome segregation protein Spo0J
MQQLAEPALYPQQELEAHPFADAFPLIEGTEFDELVASVASHGVLQPIMLFEGRILDGRNRYRALMAAGLQLMKDDLLEWSGDEAGAREYVRLQNINRRHLTPVQRAMSIVRLDGGKTTQRDLAAANGLHLTTVNHAKQLERTAAPHILDMVEGGTITMQDAIKVSRLTPKQQAKLTTPAQVKKRAHKAPSHATAAGVDDKGFTRNRIRMILTSLHRLSAVDAAVIVRRLDKNDREAVRELLPEFGAFMLNLATALNVDPATVDPDFREVGEHANAG